MLNKISKSFLSSVWLISQQIQRSDLLPLKDTNVRPSNTNSEFGLALIILSSVIFLLGIFIFLVVSSFVCFLFENLGLCQNDSWCQFFNRDFKVDTKKSEIYSIEVEASSKKKDSIDSFKSPLSNSEKITYFYGTKSEDSDESTNSCNNMSDDYLFNRQCSTLYSFRKDDFVKKEIHEPENLDSYTNYFIINALPDPKENLLESHLSDLEDIEQHLSKSLSELNELHKKLCSDNEENVQGKKLALEFYPKEENENKNSNE